jgi:subtilisin-like proprotein convertase family protein
MKTKLLLIVLSFSAFVCGYAQNAKPWSSVTSRDFKVSENTRRLSFPDEFTLFRLEANTLRQSLASAPNRFAGRTSGAVVLMPNTIGGIERFEVFEASNFEPALQAQFPEIRSYVGRGLDDKQAILRLSVDPSGIQSMIFRTDKRNEFMEPYSQDGKIYAAYNSSRNKGALPFVCSTEDVAIAQSLVPQAEQRLSNSGELLTFRLALSCNGEYTTYFGGTVAGALAAFNATMTRVNGVFEKDFAIHMNIIANTTVVIYTNAGTDPYTTMGSWNGQLQTALNNNIGNAAYDIGHMFGASGGGGNAGCIGCVCVNGSKGRGITSPADGIPMGDNFDIDYVAHEMGHQFGGNHTFSNSVEGSGVNVEPGSGSTIMGYAGITAQDIQAHSDDYFVYASVKQIQDNMVGKTCPVRTPLSNIAPVIDAGKDYIIPRSTPFVLTGSSTDANGDAITYCWEENDSATTQTGTNSQASATKTGGPNWRSYNPVSSPSRYFPPLARVAINQLTSTFMDGSVSIRTEAVSSVARELNFTLTGRDNVLGVGQTDTDAMKVTVTAAAGPFLVSSPNNARAWEARTNQEGTWAVAGTTANGVNTAYVDIYMSTDGGLTYPILLASKVPNDGAETVTMPDTVGTSSRVMVKGYDHIFYDISNTNLSVTAAASTFSVSFGGLPGGPNKTASPGADMVYTIHYTPLGGFSDVTSFSASGQPAGTTVTFSPATISGTGDVTVTVTNTSAATAGLYPIIITATSGAVSKTVPLYLELFNSAFAGVALSSPADLAVTQNTALTLSWVADSNATLYDVEVATDAAFTNIISSATVSINSYMVSGLAEATDYYWRVLPKNTSCGGVFSTPFTFETGQVACAEFSSADVPVAISVTGAPSITSTLTVADDLTISDLNITMNISHTWINDLSATLESPAGTQVQIFTNPCASASILNINATFDDSGAAVVCGANPGISGVVMSQELLSAFAGESSAGIWTLYIDDEYDQDGGALNSWSLNVCSTQPLANAENHLLNFAVYPNPNSGSFNVQFTPSSESDVKINVSDIRGRRIFEKAYASNGLFNENLQLSVEAGLYLVTVRNGNTTEVRKIIVR